MTTTANIDAGQLRHRALPVVLAAALALASCTGADGDRAKRAGVGTNIGEIGGAPVGAASEDDPSGTSSGFIYNSYKRAQEN